MLVSFFDALTGIFSKRWLIGRRIVMDFTSAKEQRVSVIALPEGSFSFELRSNKETEHVISMWTPEAGAVALATFDDIEVAEKTLKKLKLGVLRPFTKIVLAFMGVLLILLTTDIASVPKSSRLPQRSVAGAAATSPSLTPEQLNLLRERMTNPAVMPGPALGAGSASGGSSPAPAGGQAASVAPAALVPPADSSPEALAAIRLLKGN